MREEHDPDRYLNTDRLNTVLGILVTISGIVGVVWAATRANPISPWVHVIEQIGVAFLTAGTIELLFFTSIRRLKLRLTRSLATMEKDTHTAIAAANETVSAAKTQRRELSEEAYRTRVEGALFAIQ